MQGRSFEGPSATQAWLGIYAGPEKPRGFSGARLFGLTLPQVAAALQGLPGAAHCSKYKAWRGAAPVPPPLVRKQAQQNQLGLSLCAQLLARQHASCQAACAVSPCFTSKPGAAHCSKYKAWATPVAPLMVRKQIQQSQPGLPLVCKPACILPHDSLIAVQQFVGCVRASRCIMPVDPAQPEPTRAAEKSSCLH